MASVEVDLIAMNSGGVVIPTSRSRSKRLWLVVDLTTLVTHVIWLRHRRAIVDRRTIDQLVVKDLQEQLVQI